VSSSPGGARRVAAAIVLLLCVPWAVACGGPDAGSPATPTIAGGDDGGASGEQGDESGRRPMRVLAVGFDFEPDVLEVRPGETVRLTFVNTDATEHDIAFDLPEDEGGPQALAGPVASGERSGLTFRAPRTPGRYPFICRVADHEARGMRGTLLVTGEPD